MNAVKEWNDHFDELAKKNNIITKAKTDANRCYHCEKCISIQPLFAITCGMSCDECQCDHCTSAGGAL